MKLIEFVNHWDVLVAHSIFGPLRSVFRSDVAALTRSADELLLDIVNICAMNISTCVSTLCRVSAVTSEGFKVGDRKDDSKPANTTHRN